MFIKKFLLLLSTVLVAAAFALFSRATHARPGGSAAQDSGVGQMERVTVTEQGLNPKVVMLRRKIPARLTFVRETSDTCATEIHVEALGIHVALPLNEPVSVELTPTHPGRFDYGCGTGDFRGAIVIR